MLLHGLRGRGGGALASAAFAALRSSARAFRCPAAAFLLDSRSSVWVGDVLAGRYKMVLRDMRVSTGFLGNVDMGFGVPQDVAGWATILHDPHSA
ncbi:hypothetical protein [Streptomyces sp. NPDC007369]|uniref:hypothetical protein n=1 Tax=Streptomyces sp. NPDC007369 TaxID=3154589 RepID=UPI0033DC903C